MKSLRFEDTIAAPATLPGTGALTIIRMSGKDTFRILDKCLRFANGNASAAEGYTIKYATVYQSNGQLLDEVLVSIFRAPHSYTGEDSAEITCHASSYIASEMMSIIVDAGARVAGPGEFTRRAFVNGKMDLAQAEAVADLIAASGSAAHRVAMSHMKGNYSDELQAIRAELLDIASLMELELDFAEEDVEFADRNRLKELVVHATERAGSLASSFRFGNALRDGVPVAIVGAVNSGKSTLLNALVGDERALVSDIAGTTRDTVEESVTIGGILFRIIDTAGLRDTTDTVESMGIQRSYRKLSEASIVLIVVDASLPDDQISAEVSDIAGRLDFSCQQALVLFNKIDICRVNINVTNNNKYVLSAIGEIDAMTISARDNIGLEKIEKWLSDSQSALSQASESLLVTNARHYQSLIEAGRCLGKVLGGLNSGLPTDLLAEDLREAIDALASITGEITSQEILNSIFSRHCIGK